MYQTERDPLENQKKEKKKMEGGEGERNETTIFSYCLLLE